MVERTPPLPGCATIPPHAPFRSAPNSRARPSAGGTGALSPRDPLAWSDQEAEPRRPLLPPTRRDVATAAALLVAGIAWGAALAFTESLPVDFGFLVFVLQLGVGLVFIITLVHRLLFRGFHVTVVGSYTFTPSLPAVPATQGALACEWANGRWRIGILTTTTPISGLPTPHVLTVNLLDRQVQLSDGASSTLLAEGDSAVQPPPGETARGAGDRTGAIAIDVLQVNLAAGPSEVNEVRGTFRWTCPGPPS